MEFLLQYFEIVLSIEETLCGKGEGDSSHKECSLSSDKI